MDRVKFLVNKYQGELQQTINNIQQVKQEIARLDKIGIEMTARANVLAGKIEGLKELGVMDVGESTNEVLNEQNCVSEMTLEQLQEAIERGTKDV
jgi:hypothetical protein